MEIEDAQALMNTLKQKRQMNSITKQMSAKKASQPYPTEMDQQHEPERTVSTSNANKYLIKAGKKPTKQTILIYSEDQDRDEEEEINRHSQKQKQQASMESSQRIKQQQIGQKSKLATVNPN